MTIASRSATRSEDVAQTNTDSRIDTTTNSPLLNISSPLSEPNPSDLLTTASSSRVKVEIVPDSLAPLGSEISNELLSLSSDGQEEEVVKTFTLTL